MVNYFKILIGFTFIVSFICLFGCYSTSTDQGSEVENKITDLLEQMTLEEKIGQLVQYSGYDQLTGPGAKDAYTQAKYDRIKNGHVGSLLNVVSTKSTRQAQKLAVEESRLGIPLLFGYDVIHGFKTMFPVPLAETASWDLDMIKKSASVAAQESAASGLHWTFAPMVDISRDGRWGRIMEGAGEDPYLNSVVSSARVKGFQGDDLSDINTIAACAKHFAAYGYAEAGRDYNTAELSYHTLRNVVLPSFKACVDAGVATVMNSFNEIAGVPATADKHLQRDILKGEWGFKGFVVSDWGSIAEMINHGYAEDKKHAAMLAMNAGSDMDMEGYCYENSLQNLIDQKLIDEDLIDDSVRRILRVKFALGLMEDPYKYCDEDREKLLVLNKENLNISREVAKRSIVLLKNERSLLPIDRTKTNSIALLGPFADDKDVPLGNWRAQAIPNSAVSLLEGLQNELGKDVIIKHSKAFDHSLGKRGFMDEMEINDSSDLDFSKEIELAKKSDLVILTLGEDCYQSGEGRSQTNIRLSDAQMRLFNEVSAVNDNVIVVLMNGRPMVLTELESKASSILETWHLGSESGNAITDVLLGNYNPSGKLPVCFPRHEGQLPLYYAQKATGRGNPVKEVFWSHYTDEKNDALYPFGYGLSYSSFEYSDIKLNKETIVGSDTLSATIQVTNTSELPGEEVIQLYIRDRVGSVTRPLKELKAFKKEHFEAGETKQLEFKIDKDMLAFYNIDHEWVTEPGLFELFIGTNSVDCKSTRFYFEN